MKQVIKHFEQKISITVWFLIYLTTEVVMISDMILSNIYKHFRRLAKPSVHSDKTCKFYICGIITKCNNFLAIIRIFGKKRVWCMEIGKKQSLFSEKREYIMTLNQTLLIFCPKNMYNTFFYFVWLD